MNTVLTKCGNYAKWDWTDMNYRPVYAKWKWTDVNYRPVYAKWDWTDVKGQSMQNGIGQM